MTLIPPLLPPTPEFPDEMLPLLAEFRSRAKRLLVKPGRSHSDLYPLTSNLLLWWWERDDEIGAGNFATGFDPVLRTISDSEDPPQTKAQHVIEWGTTKEILEMMELLRSRMVLDDLADV